MVHYDVVSRMFVSTLAKSGVQFEKIEEAEKYDSAYEKIGSLFEDVSNALEKSKKEK